MKDHAITLLNATGSYVITAGMLMSIQITVLIGVLWITDFFLRHRVRAALRCGLWMLVILKLLTPPGLVLPTSAAYWIGPRVADPIILRALHPVRATARITDSSERFEILPAQPLPPPAQPALGRDAWLLLGWIVGVCGMAALLGLRNRALRRLLRASASASSHLEAPLRAAADQLGMRRVPELRISSAEHSPAVCGLWRPSILLPAKLVGQLSPEAWRTVFLHELLHIRRRDLWGNLLQVLVQTLWWWNPLVWFANNRIRALRETAVDEAVMLAFEHDETTYPATLVAVARYCSIQPTHALSFLGILESPKRLEMRIRRLLEQPLPKSAHLGWSGWLVLLGAGLSLLPMGFLRRVEAAPAPAPDTQVEVVKPAKGRAVVRAVRGSADYYDGSNIWKKVGVGTVLPWGAVIRTAEKSSVDLSLAAQEFNSGGAESVKKISDPSEDHQYVLAPRFPEQDSAPKDPESARAQRVKTENLTVSRYLGEMDARLEDWVAKRAKGQIGAIAAASDDPQLAMLLEKKLEAEVQLAGIVPDLGDQHPSILKARRILAEIHRQMNLRVDDLIAGLQSRREVVSEAEKNLKNRLFTRTFKVNPNTFIKGLEEATGERLNTSLTGGQILQRIRAFFESSGVSFAAAPIGESSEQHKSALFFNEGTGILFVRATLADLDTVEKGLQTLNPAPPQIMLTVKWVEGPPDRVTTLGIPWRTNSSTLQSQPTGTSQTAPTSILTEARAKVLIAKLSKTAGVDLLSAPRVTTLAGRTAQIAVTEEKSVAIGQTNRGKGVEVTAMKLATGPSIELDPTMDAKIPHAIHVRASAQIVEFLGYDKALTPSPVIRTNKASGSGLLWDGQTLVLGMGVVTNTQRWSDKVPVLGDIPVLGRLFRSSGTNVVPRQRFVLITPTIIDPAGNRINTSDKPPFNPDTIPSQ